MDKARKGKYADRGFVGHDAYKAQEVKHNVVIYIGIYKANLE